MSEDDIINLVEYHAAGNGATAAQTPTRRPPLTDLGNAERFARDHGGQARYVAVWDKWLTYTGGRWTQDERGAVMEMAKATVWRIWDDIDRSDKTQAKFAWDSQANARLRAMVALARSIPGIATIPADLDRDPWDLNLTNGTLNLRTHKLRPHRAADLITKLAPVAYDPDAQAPTWLAFLEWALPDPDVRAFVQRWAGYCLTGDVSEQKFIVAHGHGSNGKNTLFDALRAVMGPYAAVVDTESVMAKRDGSSAHPTGLCDLQGLRLAVASESESQGKLNETVVKRVVDSAPIRARKMQKDFFEFAPTHKLVMPTNHKPRISGTDKGIWRRLRLVLFEQTITEGDPGFDKDFGARLITEAPGIMAWAVAGCRAWLADGLAEPAVVAEATSTYRVDEDEYGGFFDEECVIEKGRTQSARVLHGAHEAWCKRGGIVPQSVRAFGEELSRRGLHRRRSNGVWWDGIDLRSKSQGLDW